MKKILSLLLVLIMVFSMFAMTGCGEDAKKDDNNAEATATPVVKTDADLIIGKWETSMDFGKYMKDIFAEDETMGKYVSDVENIAIKAYAEYKTDGTYVESYEEGYEAKLTTWMKNLYTTLFTNLFTDTAKESGLTLDALLASMEIESVEAYVDALMEDMDINEMFNISATSQTYTIKDGTLTTVDVIDGEETKIAFKYTLTEDTLTLTECDDEEASQLLPLTFKKIG